MDDNTAMLLAWLHASQLPPGALTPQQHAALQAIHQLLNQRMAQDPLGMISTSPPPRTFLQQREWYRANLPPIPFVERFPPPSYTTPYVGQNPHLKTGVEPLSTIEPMTGAGGIQWRL